MGAACGGQSVHHNDVGGPIAQISPLWKTRDYMLL